MPPNWAYHNAHGLETMHLDTTFRNNLHFNPTHWLLFDGVGELLLRPPGLLFPTALLWRQLLLECFIKQQYLPYSISFIYLTTPE
jgi:hypothetical protein